MDIQELKDHKVHKDLQGHQDLQDHREQHIQPHQLTQQTQHIQHTLSQLLLIQQGQHILQDQLPQHDESEFKTEI